MKIFLNVFSFALALATTSILGAVSGASTGEDRQVSLSLDNENTNDSVVFLVALPDSNRLRQTLIDGAGQDTGVPADFLEFFKVEKELLSPEQIGLLQDGGTLDAWVKPIANFRIRDETSLEIIDVTAEEAGHQLRKLSAATLCGKTVARGTMSVSFDNGKTSIDATASYSRLAPSDEKITTVGGRKLYPSVGDVCADDSQCMGQCDVLLRRPEIEKQYECDES